MNLREVIGHYCDKFLRMDQVIGVGRGFKEVDGTLTGMQAIQIFVQKKLPVEQLRRQDLVPEMFQGFLTDVIEVGTVRALGVRTERIRPAQPGISIGHYLISAGTFGALVYDRVTGQPLILSNNHILANTSTNLLPRAEIGDPVLQPGPYDNGVITEDVIGYLERYVPLRMKGTRHTVGRGMTRAAKSLRRILIPTSRQKRDEFGRFQRSVENIVDCAVAVPVDLAMVCDEIFEIGRVAGVRSPEVGDLMQKSGRTSGVTWGRVRSVDVTLTVEMGDGEESLFAGQILVDLISQGGDSGSLVLDEGRNACGLLFAGSSLVTVCNPIDAVLEALNVRF